MDVLLTDKIWENEMCASLNLEIRMDVDVDAMNDAVFNSENKSLPNDLYQWRDACLEQFGDFQQVPQVEDDGYFLIY